MFINLPIDSVVDVLQEVVKALLDVGDYNVVYVDWTGGSLGLYSQAVANARLAGLEIAHLVKFLVQHTKMHPKDVHLIGHSLGAHLAGKDTGGLT